MTKKALNQNAKYVQDLIDDVEPDFVFNLRPINRFSSIKKMMRILKMTRLTN